MPRDLSTMTDTAKACDGTLMRGLTRGYAALVSMRYFPADHVENPPYTSPQNLNPGACTAIGFEPGVAQILQQLPYIIETDEGGPLVASQTSCFNYMQHEPYDLDAHDPKYQGGDVSSIRGAVR